MERKKSSGSKVLATYLLRQKGVPTKEIMERLQVSRRTIYRYVKTIKDTIEEL